MGEFLLTMQISILSAISKHIFSQMGGIDILQRFAFSGTLLMTVAPIDVQSLGRGVRMIAMTETKQKLIKAVFQAHEREIVKPVVGLGFTVDYPHNKANSLVESNKKIVEISAGVGFSDVFTLK